MTPNQIAELVDKLVKVSQYNSTESARLIMTNILTKALGEES